MQNFYRTLPSFAVIVLLACSHFSHALMPAPNPAPSSAPTLAQDEVLRREAQRFADAYWKRILTKCGDSYYWKRYFQESNQTYYEAKGVPSISVRGRYIPPRTLTRAERLNGVDPQPLEFDGMMTLRFDVFRTADKPSTLTIRQWKDSFTFTMNVHKSKGKWDTIEDSTRNMPTPCGEISGERQMRRDIDLGYYCSRKYGSSAVDTVTPGDAFSWRCKSNEGYFEINMEQACEWKYGDHFKATYDDPKDHTSWHCVLKTERGNNSRPKTTRNPLIISQIIPEAKPVTNSGTWMVKEWRGWDGGLGRQWEVTVSKSDGWLSTGIPISVNQDISILSPLPSRQPAFSLQLGDQVIQSTYNETTRVGWVLHAGLREQDSGGGKGLWGVPPGWNDVIRLKIEDPSQASALILRVTVSDADRNRREGDKRIGLPLLGKGSDLGNIESGGQLMRRGLENLGSYCTGKYGMFATLSFTEGDAFSWHCKNGRENYRIDMDDACRWEHGNYFTAKLDDRNDHKSWHCVPKSGQDIAPANNNSNQEAPQLKPRDANDRLVWTKVRAGILAADDLRDAIIYINVENGVVTLTGTVVNGTQKVIAADITRKTDGVKGVYNNLIVPPR